MPRKSDTAPSPEDIRALRGARSRAELAERLGVTALTVYRWELSPDAPEARRPRGAVLARLLAFLEEDRARASTTDPPPTSAPASVTLDREEKASLAPTRAAMDDGRLEQAEGELLVLLASGALRSEASRRG